MQMHLEADRRGISRRQFLKIGGGLAGAAAISMLPGVVAAAQPGSGLPNQLPYTSPTLKAITGLDIPFFLPFEVNPFIGGDNDPTTIKDFNGFVGVIEASGHSHPDHNSDGVARTWGCDVRFMKGVFVNRAGNKQHGSFGFFWLDVYEDPSLGPQDPGQVQIHDFNPGDLNPAGANNYFMDGGVFWTAPVPDHSISINPGNGNAHFNPSISTLDYFTVVNALFRNGDAPLEASANVDVHWVGNGERAEVDNSSQGFSGRYENATGHINWSASNSTGYWFSTENSNDVHVADSFTAHVRTGSFHP